MKFIKTVFEKIIEYIHFIVVFILLIALYPYEFYSAFLIDYSNNTTFLYTLFVVVFSVLLLFFRKQKPNIPNYLYVIIFMQFLGLVFNNLAKGDSVPIGQMLLKLTALYMVVYLSSTCGLISFFRKYNRWILVMGGLATLSLVLIWIGKLQPLYPFIDLADDSIMYNFGITFSQNTDPISFRPAGYFDEPGTLASWGMFALLFNRAFVKDGKIELLIILSMLATFSFGFFFQLFAYVVLFMFSGTEIKKSIKKLVLITITIVIGLSVLYGLKGTEYDGIYEKTIGRVEETIKGGKSDKNSSAIANAGGDSRKELTIIAIKEFKENPLWGTKNKNFEGGNNIYEPLALYGIFGTFFYYFPFIFLFLKACADKDSVLIKCMIVMILGFFHRPFHNNLLSHFIIYSFIAMYYQYRIQQKQALKRVEYSPSNKDYKIESK